MKSRTDGSKPLLAQASLPMVDVQLEPRVGKGFAPLCGVLPVDKVPPLKDQVRSHVEAIRQALTKNEFLDVATAEEIAGVLVRLLDEYEASPESHKELIVGAARYFIKTDDTKSDEMSPLGFDDDVAVLNYVLVAVGKPELKIEL